MITEEKWREVEFAAKRDALRAETDELWVAIHRLEQHQRNFMRGGVDEMRSRFDALDEKTDEMLEKIAHLACVIMIMQRDLTSRLERVGAMLGIVEQ